QTGAHRKRSARTAADDRRRPCPALILFEPDAPASSALERYAMNTPIQYLDKAMLRLRDLGLVPEKTEEAPIIALLNRLSHLDEDKVVATARTLSQASLFNQVVREQVAAMNLSDRYTKITDAFNSIRDAAKSMV